MRGIGKANEGENYKGNGFIDIAFNEKEKEIIIESKIDNSKRSCCMITNKYSSKNTVDKVYLLSMKEYKRYRELIRWPRVGEFALDESAYWLRSPGKGYGEKEKGTIGRNAWVVRTDPRCSEFIALDCSENIGIRPVIQININKPNE